MSHFPADDYLYTECPLQSQQREHRGEVLKSRNISLKSERESVARRFAQSPENASQRDATGARPADPLQKAIETTHENLLDSWKQIACYLDRNVRTVQRWEKCEQLPVYRHIHNTNASVYAFKSEIDAWRRSRSSLAERVAVMQLVPKENGRAGHPVDGGLTLRCGVSTSNANHPAGDPAEDTPITYVLCSPGTLFGQTVIRFSSSGTTSLRGERQWNGSHLSTKRST